MFSLLEAVKEKQFERQHQKVWFEDNLNFFKAVLSSV